jgi:ATP-dependent phosphoenolpyruvate carboxykinase
MSAAAAAADADAAAAAVPPSKHTQAHGTHAWLVNTGWTGGRYGVGQRMSIAHTRSIIDAIHSGELETAEYIETPIFHLKVCIRRV